MIPQKSKSRMCAFRERMKEKGYFRFETWIPASLKNEVRKLIESFVKEKKEEK